jgi:integrase/recombinase XerD
VRTRAGGRLSPQLALGSYLAALLDRPAVAVMARAVLPLFFAHLEGLGVGDLRAAREEHLVSYARKLRTVAGKRGHVATISTQRSFLSTVRGLFSFLLSRRLILRDPSRELVLPRAERLPGAVPGEAQVRRLLQAPFPCHRRGIRDRAILEVLYGTGLRVSECVRLDVVDLDLAEGALLVRNGKGKKDRVLPVGGRAALALELYLREARPLFRKSSQDQALFLSTLGGRLTRSAVEARVRALQKAVASPVWISPHVLRHACATHLLRGGADVRQVQELLGHKRLETTALYTRVNVQDLAAVLAKAHPRERAWSRSRSRRQRDRIASS